MRQLYYKVNSFRGGYRRQDKFLKNDDGSLLTNQEGKIEKWAEYFKKLINCEEPVDIFTYSFNKPNDNPCPAHIKGGNRTINQKAQKPQVTWER
ncbi:Hypothetical protein CINCED_3A019789 [Cinara cedri]|uniref:Uncharacterized protein n=1 Tax=Cinara cedri TaxID=506608 RepID=A0A5E4NR41_9HEMI|nr:Hypothetical protein CINCED_3A019789 [Cinara cedri]